MKINASSPDNRDPEFTVSITMKQSEWTVIQKLYWYTTSIPEKVKQEDRLSNENHALLKRYMIEMYDTLRDKVV